VSKSWGNFHFKANYSFKNERDVRGGNASSALWLVCAILYITSLVFVHVC